MRIEGREIVRRTALACALLGLWSLLGCRIFSSKPEVCGTEVGDPTDQFVTKGCVENADGGPAVGARVIAWPQGGVSPVRASDSAPGTVDTQLTDAMGQFAFGSRLAQGNYDLYFEETTGNANERHVQSMGGVRQGPGRQTLPTARLSLPIMLSMVVKDKDNQDTIPGADCFVLQTPYKHTSGEQGITYFYLPQGSYTVSCIATGWNSGQLQVDLRTGVDTQLVFYLSQNGSGPSPLPPPSDFKVDYDTNSGVVNLSWSPVKNPRLLKYGIRKIDEDLGGGAQEFPTINTYWMDVAFFGREDSVQRKNLRYRVYSLLRDPGGYVGESATDPITLKAQRPWVYGPRVDSLTLLNPDSAYQAGDQIPIVAYWTNSARGNDSLYWRVAGSDHMLRVVEHPADSGQDTLHFSLPDAGDPEIGVLIRDSAGYRSWSSLKYIRH